eukprot:2474795-Pyramimonas_sp.AAC.1
MLRWRAAESALHCVRAWAEQADDRRRRRLLPAPLVAKRRIRCLRWGLDGLEELRDRRKRATRADHRRRCAHAELIERPKILQPRQREQNPKS